MKWKLLVSSWRSQQNTAGGKINYFISIRVEVMLQNLLNTKDMMHTYKVRFCVYIFLIDKLLGGAHNDIGTIAPSLRICFYQLVKTENVRQSNSQVLHICFPLHYNTVNSISQNYKSFISITNKRA